VALGVERRDLLQLPRMPFPGALPLPEGLGWQYVLESLTLNGKQLSRHLARQLPAEIQCAAGYLGCYGDDVTERWRQVCAAIDACDHSERDADRILATVGEGFAQMRAWVHPKAQARPSRIHA
jgi:heme oxygenase